MKAELKHRRRAIAALKDCQDAKDKEKAHMVADDVLCNLLTQLGYADVVAEFTKLKKWYS